MNPVLFIAGPLLGFVGMLSGGYWGVGCGWIVVPVLLILGFEPLDAVGIGLLQMVPSTLLTVMRQAPEIGWKPGEPGRSLAIPVGIGALLTSLCGKTINHRLYELCGAAPLQWMLIGLITFIAVQTLCSRTRCYNDTMPPVTPFRSRIAFATGLVTGLVSSLLGVGGGLLIRPLLTSGFQVPEYYTSRIVRLLVLVTTVTGGVTYLVSATGFNWQMFGAAMLIAVGGIGFYQERGKEARKLLPGDVVEIPPDVDHWHGAAPDSWFSHLAIECNPEKNKNTWLEPVSDADYRKATAEK